MHPDLLAGTGIGIVLPAYGVMIALGYLAALSVAGREAPRVGLDRGAVIDLMFWLMMAAIVGSRLAFLAVRWEFFYDLCFDPQDALPSIPCTPLGACPDLQVCDAGTCATVRNCTAALELWRGGFVFYGGVAAAALVLWRFSLRHRAGFGLLSDTLVPSVALAHVFGRIGCYLAGCCYGCRTDLPWGVTFPPGSEAWLLGGPIHPTQLYEAAVELLLFGLLLRVRANKRFHGEVLAAWVALYATARFLIELLRGDAQRGHWGPLSTSQWVALAALVGAGVVWWAGRASAGASGPLARGSSARR
ncbi:MAG: hypothetical protein AMXMBFR64_29660 [Myxococcales bacterium]